MNPLKTGVCDMDGVKVPEEKKGGVVSDWKDEAAFEKLFREWYAPLCGYAESLLHDRDASEDAVQGVFCTLWEKRTVLRVEESVKSYLYRAVYNAAINMLEHEKVKAAFARFVHEREEQGEERHAQDHGQGGEHHGVDHGLDLAGGVCPGLLHGVRHVAGGGGCKGRDHAQGGHQQGQEQDPNALFSDTHS